MKTIRQTRLVTSALWGILVVLLWSQAAWSSVDGSSPARTRLELYAVDNPAQPFLAVFFLTPEAGWHAYGNEPGPTGIPTSLRVDVHGASVPTLYPPAVSLPDPLDPSVIVPQYTGEVTLFAPLQRFPEGEVRARLEALLCSATTCYPVRETYTFAFSPVDTAGLPQAESQPWWPLVAQARPGAEEAAAGAGDRDSATAHSAVEQQASGTRVFTPRYFAPGLEVRTLSKAAGLAFLAGLILNFMPCVLPVITLKLRSFIPAVGRVPMEQRAAFRAHNLFFALGMMLYFLVLAGVIAVTGMAWGQIFQQPAAIITLTAVVFGLSLSLFGVYDLPLIDLKGKAAGVVHHPRLESFITGILATILATPCSGPFLGGVLAWALVQPPKIIALVLSCIGLGMASPYVLMAMFPSMYAFLPRAGAWTVHVERFLGFLLVGTCVYLLGLLPASAYLDVLILLWTIALAAWAWGQWTSLAQSALRRWAIRGAGIVLVAGVALFLFRPQPDVEAWKPFDVTYFESVLGRRHVVLDFTADWCPNCKFLEKTVLTPERSAALADEFDLELLRVDLTRHDPPLMALLESLGSKSIPVLAIFPQDRPDSPLVLRDLFTSGQLREALEAEVRSFQ